MVHKSSQWTRVPARTRPDVPVLYPPRATGRSRGGRIIGRLDPEGRSSQGEGMGRSRRGDHRAGLGGDAACPVRCGPDSRRARQRPRPRDGNLARDDARVRRQHRHHPTPVRHLDGASNVPLPDPRLRRCRTPRPPRQDRRARPRAADHARESGRWDSASPSSPSVPA